APRRRVSRLTSSRTVTSTSPSSSPTTHPTRAPCARRNRSIVCAKSDGRVAGRSASHTRTSGANASPVAARKPPTAASSAHRLAVLGLVAVAWSVWEAHLWALLAAVGGLLAATGRAFAPLGRGWPAERPATRPSDFAHTIDLLRRAHGALVGWVVGLEEGDVEVTVRDDVSRDTRRRGAAIVQLASVDGRAHVAREPEGTYVAVGDFPFG